MKGRALALTVLLAGAMVSFGLAVWSAWQGRVPVVETSHAVLFAFMGLLLAARHPQSGGAHCRECGHAFLGGMPFCAHCGRYPKHARSGI